ncbi:hypothetical protein Vretimale_668, partial [Volvox reticuliferus]
MKPVLTLRPLQRHDPRYLFVLPHKEPSAGFGIEGPSSLLTSDDGALPLLTAVLAQEIPDGSFGKEALLLGSLPVKKATKVPQTTCKMQHPQSRQKRGHEQEEEDGDEEE